MFDPRTMQDNMSGLAQFALFAAISATYLPILADCYYTGEGLAKGLTEGNPVLRPIIKKIGLAATCFLGAAFYIGAAGLVSVYSPAIAFVIAGSVGAVETFNALRNKKLVGK